LWSLVRALPDGRPVFGFQAVGIDDREPPDPSVDTMVERYVNALRAFAPGPYLLGGYSGGGIVALEMSRRLIAHGDQVVKVVLFDSIPVEFSHPRWPAQVRNLAVNLVRFGPKAVVPYARSAWRRTVVRWTPERVIRAREQDQREQWTELGYGDTSDIGIVNLYDHFTELAQAHPLGRYDVDVVLVKAGEVWPIHPADYHWHRYVTGRIDVRVSPGDHHAMFAPEHTAALAAVLTPLLGDAPRGSGTA